MQNNGIFENLSHSAYHAMTDRISNSYLSRLDKCPAAAKVKQEETPAMTFGRAFHCFILDGMAAFSRDVLVLPEINRRTSAGKEEYQALVTNNPEKAIITQEDLQSIMEMDKSVKAHPLAKNLIGTGTNEVSVFWDDPFSGLPCKARPDKVPGQNTLVDLKSIADATAHGFQSSVISFRYASQAAFYLDGINKATGGGFDLFAFIAVEKKEPYKVGVFTLSADFIEYGRQDYRRLLVVEMNCREKNLWPNYTEDSAIEIGVPKWLA